MKIYSCPLCKSIAVENTPGIQRCTGAACSFECKIGTSEEKAVMMEKENDAKKPLRQQLNWCWGRMCSQCRVRDGHCEFLNHVNWCVDMKAVIRHVNRTVKIDDYVRLCNLTAWFRRYISGHNYGRLVLRSLEYDIENFDNI